MNSVLVFVINEYDAPTIVQIYRELTCPLTRELM